MNNKKNYKKGTRKEINELIHMCGIIPEKSLKYIGDKNYRVMRMKIRQMINEGVLEYKKRKGLPRAIVLCENGKDRDRCEESLPAKLAEFYKNFGKTDSKRYQYSTTPGAAERVFYNSDTMIFMHGCGIKMLATEKEGLLKKLGEEALYYTSREIKNGIGYKADVIEKEDSVNVNSSRLRGLVLSQGGAYGIYRLPTLTSYSQNGEYKMKLYLDKIVREKMGNGEELKEAVIIADNDRKEIIENLIKAEKQNVKYRFESMEFVYKSIYGIPADEIGQQMMKLFTVNNWKKKIIDSFGLPDDDNRKGVACDGADGERYYYVYCVPDIKRFRKFLARAEVENDRNRFVVICFDWQVEAVKKIAGRVVRIKSVPFAEYMAEMNLI